jgi:electron transfer flavoprotein beta subunit
MGLEILVCIKQVPHPDRFSEIRLDVGSGRIIREGIPAIINPLDHHALEEGLRVKERFSGTVTAVSMGPPQAQKALGEALAMGADRGILLCDEAFAGADTLATARTLFYAIQKLGKFDLIYCGNETVDSGTAQVGPQLAELLDTPQVSGVEEVTFSDEKILEVKRALEHGYMKVRLKLPAVLCVTRAVNKPRLPTVQSIMEVAQKEMIIWKAEDIGAPLDSIGLRGSPTCAAGVYEHKAGRRREIMEGSTEEKVHRAVARLKELGAI